MLVYGKETDREARAEVVLAKSQQFEATLQLVADLTDGLLMGDEWSEELLDTMPSESAELFPSLRLPDETNLSDRRRLSAAALQASFSEKWPQLPMTVLDEKTPQEVAGDETYRVRLTAALLVLEQLAEARSWDLDVDRLREQLGMPTDSPIDPGELEDGTVEPHRWHLLQVEKLEDADLVRRFYKAALFQARRATRKLGAELLQREHLTEMVDMSEVAGSMAKLEDNPDLTLQRLADARRWAEKLNKSPARWYLEELPLRLMMGDAARVQHLMELLSTRHNHEPGVSQSLYNILMRFGIITPDGRMVGQAGAAGPAPDDAVPASDDGPKIWTPDAPASSPAGKKDSKLWVPGMD
jgi:hypothetical protein